MKKLLIKVGILILFTVVSAEVFALPDVKLIVEVVDQDGKPVEGARVGGSFYNKRKGPREFTDKDGKAILKASTSGLVRFGARKEGYYRTREEEGNFQEYAGVLGFRKWKPYERHRKIVLRKQVNPIAMYSEYITELPFPLLDRFIGFDLEKRDWVIPYGVGIQSDFLMKFEVKRMLSPFDFHILFTLRFSNPLDGVQSFSSNLRHGSEFKSPYNAPIEGYLPELKYDFSRREKGSHDISKYSVPEDTHYLFRVRSKTNEKGELISALYGKTDGFFKWYITKDKKKADISFRYFLNPNKNDTNLEHDPKKNLFKRK